MAEMTAKDWLRCLPFKGREKDVPAGVSLPSGVQLEDLVIEFKKTSQGTIYNAVLDEDLIGQLTTTWGPAAVLITTANSENLTRQEWYDRYGTDGLKAWAIVSEVRKKTGGGIQF